MSLEFNIINVWKYWRKKGLPPLIIPMVLAGVVLFAEGAAVEHQKGRFTAVFDEYNSLSSTQEIKKRLRIPVKSGAIDNHHYAIKNESFEVYVPDAYDPNATGASFGLLVWVSPGTDGRIEHYKGAETLMDKHKLIWVGANNSGNQMETYNRRIPLALDAAFNMQKLYEIDPDRVYIAGLSGGGRVASMTAINYSDIFDGGIFIIGANYWQDMLVPDKPGICWKSHCPVPYRVLLQRAKKYGRYVLLTGDHDTNRLQMHTYYEKGYKRLFDRVLYIQVPGMGHEVPPPEAFDQALEFVDTPVPREDKKTEKQKP